MRALLVGSVVVALIAPVVCGSPPGGATIRILHLIVDGEPAEGLLALPHGPAKALVVITHGYTHDSESHRTHLTEIAKRGAIGVAMDFRGDPDGFNLASGAADTWAATEYVLHRHKVDTVILWSVSMGASPGGILLAEHPDVYDYWIASEPMANLLETWTEATAVSPALSVGAVAARAIENETGGTPLEKPAAFRERTAVLRVPEFQGLQGAFVLHGLWDGFVPYDQGRELVTALRAHGTPTDMVTVLRGEPGGEGTTFTGYGGQQLDGLAGHGTESNDTHTLTKASWELTYRFLEDGLTPAPIDRESVYDRDLSGAPGLV